MVNVFFSFVNKVAVHIVQDWIFKTACLGFEDRLNEQNHKVHKRPRFQRFRKYIEDISNGMFVLLFFWFSSSFSASFRQHNKVL